MKETIKLNDFLAEVTKSHPLADFGESIKLEVETSMICPKCGKGQSNGEFCSNDGSKLEEKKYEVRSEEAGHEIRRLFYDFESGLDMDEEFLYEFVDSTETYDDDHDGDKYFLNYIFKRKSDGKHFEFTMDSYGDLDENDLREVKNKTKKTTTWE